MQLTKLLTLELDRVHEFSVFQKLERVHKITQMVNEGKTDGKFRQVLDFTTRDFEDYDIKVTASWRFRDLDAVNEFLDYWLNFLNAYGVKPLSINIEDIASGVE